MNAGKYTVARPVIGKPTDKLTTAAYLAIRPELSGLAPFDPLSDVDLIDEINRVAANLLAAGTLQYGTNSERLAINTAGLTSPVLFRVLGGALLSYVPGVGWRDPYGGDPDGPPPPPDTGAI